MKREGKGGFLSLPAGINETRATRMGPSRGTPQRCIYFRSHTPPVLGGVALVFLDMRPWDAGRGLFHRG